MLDSQCLEDKETRTAASEGEATRRDHVSVNHEDDVDASWVGEEFQKLGNICPPISRFGLHGGMAYGVLDKLL